MEHAITIFLKMSPSDFDDLPDIHLHLDSYEAVENEEILNSLDRGQEIGFNATIIKLTEENKGMEMQGLKIWREKGILEIFALYNENGRYKSKENKKFLDKNSN